MADLMHDPGQRSSSAKASEDKRRKSEIAAIHVGKKFLDLDDVTYRALLTRLTGKDSTAQMTPAERGRVLGYMREQGFNDTRPMRSSGMDGRGIAHGPMQGLIRALWLSLYHLGEIHDASETALAHFASNELEKNGRPRVDALQWLDGEGCDVVIKALRGWCARVGLQQPLAVYARQVEQWRKGASLSPGGPGFAAKVVLIGALWERLEVAGALRHGAHARLETWLRTRFRGTAAPWFLSPAEADRAVEQLGAWLRKVKQ